MASNRVIKESQSFRYKVQLLREEQRRQRSSSPFWGTGVHPNGQLGMDSDNYAAGVSGFSLRGGDGFLEINDIQLRGNIIGNAALSNPVIPGQQFIGTNTFGVTVAGAYILTRTATVPAGCDTATVTAFGRVIATNSTGTDDALYSTIDINGAGGNQFGTDVRAGKFSTSSVGFSTTLTGLTPGGSVVTRLYASTGLASWASSASNAADLSVTILWTR